MSIEESYENGRTPCTYGESMESLSASSFSALLQVHRLLFESFRIMNMNRANASYIQFERLPVSSREFQRPDSPIRQKPSVFPELKSKPGR